MKVKLEECIIVSREINSKFILAKNRDRAYKPKLEIVREILNGVEVAYLHDMTTDWSEGLNEKGIGVVNAALLVGNDEAEKKLIKKTGKHGPDGAKMRNIMMQPTIKEAIKAALTFKGQSELALKGHTFISSANQMVSIETTSQHKPILKLNNITHPVVRTNHGHMFSDAGYTHGIKHLSSKMRKISAEKSVDSVTDWRQIGQAMRKQFFGKGSQLNMSRDTDSMLTSSQTIMNLTDKILEIEYYADRVEEFTGVRNNLPEGYVAKIKVIVKKIG